MANKKFKCTVCGYIHEGATAPESCPTCKAPASAFVEIKAEKKGLSTNSNAYTIIYAAVLVVIVAFLLAFVSSSLKERQDTNVKLDTMKQILASVNIQTADAEAEFNKNVKDMLLQADGTLKENDAAFATSYGSEFKNKRYHVFVVNTDKGTKYVFPLSGNGLWGGIWGYVSVNDDKNTVYGTYFSHESETPGLGAEITTAAFQQPFVGKKVCDANGIALTVVKNGNAQGDSQVDGISGGTLTSNGVADMLSSCLNNYKSFLNK